MVGLSIFDFAKKPIFLISVIVFTVIISILIYQIPMVKFRIDDTAALFFSDNVTKKNIDKTNLSTYALYSNYRVTLEVLKDYPIFGFGWGNYERIYNMYLPKALPKNKFYRTEISKNDASGLFLRIAAELGIFSLLTIIIIIFRGRLRIKCIDFKSPVHKDYWLINNGILVLIFLRFIRQGNYFMLGFALFLILYFLSNKKSLNYKFNAIKEAH